MLITRASVGGILWFTVVCLNVGALLVLAQANVPEVARC